MIGFRFVHAERNRHGKPVYYFRRGKTAPRIRLPDDPQSPLFEVAYFRALHEGLPTELPLPPSFDQQKRSRIEKHVDSAIKRARQRARDKGLPFDLTKEWAIAAIEAQDFRCSVTGIVFFAPSRSASCRDPYAPSFDRVDSSKGYTTANVRIVVLALNVMLCDWGEPVFERVANCFRQRKFRPSMPAP